MTPISMAQIIGSAVAPPPELASGAETDMEIAWITPSTADAAPATWVA